MSTPYALPEVTMEQIKHLVSQRAIDGETVILNMGPQHPSTHGVLRLLLELDGETVITCVPDIGFLHTGIEKNMESKTYMKAEVMTDRLDYLNTIGNNFAYCLAVEKMISLDVPPRAQALRVILAELQRVASHLVWLGTAALDVAAMSVFLYAFREREIILDVFELVSGQRMMTTFIRPGGLWRDVPVEFDDAVRNILNTFPKRIDEYEALLTKNPLFLDRTMGIGKITAEEALSWGVTGSSLRGPGPDWDLRKKRPYSGYEQYNFEVPTATEGDVYARYLVRIREMREALKIIEQALTKLPLGPVRANDHKFVPPPRSDIGVSMESLIHHFKLWTEGFDVPKGSVYSAVESPRGELGVFLESDGGPKPFRIHWRTPSFNNLEALPLMAKGLLIADLVAIIGSVDIVLGDVDQMSLSEKYPQEIEKVLAKYPPEHKRSAVMALLYMAQREEGYVSKADKADIAKILDMTTTEVSAIVGFYSLYHDKKAGQYRIQVCTDIGCALRGADQYLADLCKKLDVKPGETTADGLVTIEEVKCLAACDKAPMFQVQSGDGIKYHEQMTIDTTLELIEALRKDAKEAK